MARYTVTYPRIPGAQPTTTEHPTLAAARAEGRSTLDRGDLCAQDVILRVYSDEIDPAHFIRAEHVGPHR